MKSELWHFTSGIIINTTNDCINLFCSHRLLKLFRRIDVYYSKWSLVLIDQAMHLSLTESAHFVLWNLENCKSVSWIFMGTYRLKMCVSILHSEMLKTQWSIRGERKVLLCYSVFLCFMCLNLLYNVPIFIWGKLK